MAKYEGPSKTDALRWQAEAIVSNALKSSPAYKKAVKQAMDDLRTTQKAAAKTLKK